LLQQAAHDTSALFMEAKAMIERVGLDKSRKKRSWMRFGAGDVLHAKRKSIFWCLFEAVKSRFASSLDRPKQAARMSGRGLLFQ
jgi:hypothetical protein